MPLGRDRRGVRMTTTFFFFWVYDWQRFFFWGGGKHAVHSTRNERTAGYEFNEM